MQQHPDKSWSFDVPPDAAVVTSTYVTRHGMPILYVSHASDPEDGEVIWQFHCGNGDMDPAVLQLVGLAEIVKRDPSIGELAGLPLGFCATRAAMGAGWVIEPDP